MINQMNHTAVVPGDRASARATTACTTSPPSGTTSALKSSTASGKNAKHSPANSFTTSAAHNSSTGSASFPSTTSPAPSFKSSSHTRMKWPTPSVPTVVSSNTAPAAASKPDCFSTLSTTPPRTFRSTSPANICSTPPRYFGELPESESPPRLRRLHPALLASRRRGARRTAIYFPGSTIGNFEPHDARTFLRSAARLCGPGGALLIGVDLKKDPALLHAAYNDAAKVTADFNLNLLHRINRELEGDFATDRFAHYAFYNPRPRQN